MKEIEKLRKRWQENAELYAKEREKRQISEHELACARDEIRRLQYELESVRKDRERSTGISSALENVREFHQAGGIVNRSADEEPALVDSLNRWSFYLSEHKELKDALIDGDIVEAADAYADIIYILLGTALIQMGADRFAAVWNEVHSSNMRKCDDAGKLVVSANGKILKPKGWKPPDIRKALRLGAVSGKVSWTVGSDGDR